MTNKITGNIIGNYCMLHKNVDFYHYVDIKSKGLRKDGKKTKNKCNL